MSIPRLLAKGVKPAESLALFRSRLASLNPGFNAIVATPSATDLDQQAASVVDDAPLRGVPVAIKEVIDVAGMQTTLCDPSLQQSFLSELYRHPKTEAQEADFVKSLRSKGALIVGKTNIPKKGLDVQTFNDVYGVTNNPWDSLRTPGGSSGGSAAAVALGIVPAALGTDLGGSLRIPVAYCGVSSMRCSYGVVPSHGQHPPAAPATDPEAESSLQMGVIARDVASVGTVVKAAGNLPDGDGEPLRMRATVSPGIGGMRADSRAVAYLDTHLPRYLEQTGMQWHDSTSSADALNMKTINQAYVAFSRRYFIEMQGRTPAAKLERAVGMREELRSVVDGILDDADADAWILPVAPAAFAFEHNPKHERVPVMLEDGSTKPLNYFMATLSFVTLATVTGNPVVTMPVGFVTGADGTKLPLGVQVIGRRGQDASLLAFCQQLEGSIREEHGDFLPPGAATAGGDQSLW